MKRRIVVFIVEGPTDRDSIQEALTELFTGIHFLVIHGDITSNEKMIPANILAELGNKLKRELSIYHFSPKQVTHIFHLMDTDGAYIPDERIFEGVDFMYQKDCITHPNPASIMQRNRRKRQLMDMLAGKNTLCAIPYSCYYFARNLEHVLHDIADELTSVEKQEYSYQFAERYVGNAAGFIPFFKDSAFAVPGDYSETWNFIRRGLHSLQRYSNFHLALEVLVQDARFHRS